MSGRRAAFFDRDGTLIKDVPYLDDPARVELLPGAVEGLARLAAAGWALVLATNQSGVARGLFTEERLAAIHRRLAELLAARGVALDGLYYCPHLAEGRVAPYALACACRKPEPGMLKAAARDLGLDLARSGMVGDGPADVEAGRRAGCGRVIRIGSAGAGGGSAGPAPDAWARDLEEAADLLLAR